MAQKTDFSKQQTLNSGDPGNLRINGKPLRDLSDVELSQAVVWFETNAPAHDQAFVQAHEKHMSFHMARGAALYEQSRRRHGIQLVNGLPAPPGAVR